VSNVRPDATVDEILDTIREIQNDMTRNRDLDTAATLGATLADLMLELDKRLAGGEPLPQVWQQGRNVPDPTAILAGLVRTEAEFASAVGRSGDDPSVRTAIHIARQYADSMEGVPGFDRQAFFAACQPGKES
jgi:hypothetical protein